MIDEAPIGGEGYVMGPWRDGRATLTATATNPTALLAAALTGLLAASQVAGAPSRSEDEATTALAIRAEAPDVAGLFAGLAAALIDDIDHNAYDVRAVRFDGMVRTDSGLAGWGYALAVAGCRGAVPVAVEDASFLGPDVRGDITLRATVRRLDERTEGA